MNRSMVLPVRILAGTFIVAMSAMPQYTISARPGVINSIEGTAYVNGAHVTDAKAAQRMFLSANDTLATDAGKAEVLLTPGVYLRMGDHSEVRMISPSLTDTQVSVVKGEAMIEAMELLKENSVRVKVGESTTQLEKIGLYRFTANSPAAVSVFEGKALVELGAKKVDLGKDHLAALDANLKVEKFKGKDDQGDLYAWSKTRDEYDSASSYATSKTLASNSFSGGGWGGYGFSGFAGYGGPGWFYNPAFSSYAWLPGEGAYFSPFGYGFYSPGYVNYAPVVYSSLGGIRTGGGVAVPVNVNHVPTISGARPAVVVPAASRGNSVIASGVGAGGGHISAANIGRAGGSSGPSSGGFAGSGSGGRAMSMSSSGASSASSGGHSGGGSGGGGHK